MHHGNTVWIGMKNTLEIIWPALAIYIKVLTLHSFSNNFKSNSPLLRCIYRNRSGQAKWAVSLDSVKWERWRTTCIAWLKESEIKEEKKRKTTEKGRKGKRNVERGQGWHKRSRGVTRDRSKTESDNTTVTVTSFQQYHIWLCQS